MNAKTVKATDTNSNPAETSSVNKAVTKKAVTKKSTTSSTKSPTKKVAASTPTETVGAEKIAPTKKSAAVKKVTKNQESSPQAEPLITLADSISTETIERLFACQHADPFAVLGLHKHADGFYLNALLPNAAHVNVKIVDQTGSLIEPIAMTQLDERGFFHLTFSPAESAQITPHSHYQFEATWLNEQGEAHTVILEDPYRFGLIIPDMDLWLFSEGKHLRPYQQLGAHITEIDGVHGVRFAVWAPNAQRVAVVGDFNFWDARRHAMRLRREAGIWEIFVPHATAGDHYKFEIRDCYGNTQQKSDPYAFSAQLRPDTASIVVALPEQIVPPATRYQANGFDKPISIYEVHLGSWRRHIEDHSWLSYQELAEQLIDYVKYMGFTHIELLPITEYPFDGSWGYQPTGLYAPTSRFGSPEDFRALITKAHEANIGVIMDWVPAHFPNDAHGLQQFDGTALYEHADPREGFHQDWNTLIFNYGRNEVRNYLTGSALYWVEHFGADALRVDAVSSMIYRDYSRAEGEWIPNHYGGRENLEAISLLQEANSIVGQQCQHAVMIAEESTDFSGVTLPPEHDGLGFHYKWNMGWMHDTLNYMHRDPIYRKHHHHQMTFGMMYHYTENFILSLSHDEVVHGKGSILSRMPGDEWQKFANLRAYYGYMWAHPGKKLLFMGSEFAQVREWHHDSSLDWHLLDDTEGFHAGVQTFVRDLNRLYQDYPPLYEQDYQHEGFEWLVVDDHEHSIYAFLRRDKQGNEILAVSNFTPVPRYEYRIGVNNPGFYREILNSDSAFYHGSNLGNHGGVHSESFSAHHRAYSVNVTIPALSTVYFLLEREDAKQVKNAKKSGKRVADK